MYEKILIATDGSTFADEALKHGLELARSVGSAVVVATVTERWSALDMAHRTTANVPNPVDEFEKAAAAAAEKILASAEALAMKSDVSAECVHVKDQHPAEGIIQAANSHNCDLIVMASHGRRGIRKVLLGSVAAEVLTHSKRPILIVKAL